MKKIFPRQKLFSTVFTFGFLVILLFYTGKNIPVVHGDLATDCRTAWCEAPDYLIEKTDGQLGCTKKAGYCGGDNWVCRGACPARNLATDCKELNCAAPDYLRRKTSSGELDCRDWEFVKEGNCSSGTDWVCWGACPAAAPPPADPPPAAAAPLANPDSCTAKNNGKKVEITYMKYSSTDGRCGLSWTGVGFQYYYNRIPDKGECTNGKCVGSIKVECNLDQTAGDKQISDAAIAFAKIQPDEDVYINGVLTCDIAASLLPPPPPGPPCAEWGKVGTPQEGACLKVATSLFQGKNKSDGDISTDPGQFIVRILAIILSFAGGIAILLIISAGYKIMTSKGKPEAIQQGRDQLISAIVGLIFIIFSFVIFQLVVTDILKIPGIS